MRATAENGSRGEQRGGRDPANGALEPRAHHHGDSPGAEAPAESDGVLNKRVHARVKYEVATREVEKCINECGRIIE